MTEDVTPRLLPPSLGYMGEVKVRFTAAAVVVAVALIGSAARAEDAPRASSRVVRGGAASIGVDEAVGDLILVDAKVELAGVVRGHVYAVDSELTVRSTAVVLRSITVHRGSMRLEEGAVLPPEIMIAGAAVHRPDGEAIAAALPGAKTEKIELTRGGVTATLGPTKLSTVALALMKSVLPFDRFAPEDSTSLEALTTWHPGLGLELKKNVDDPRELMIAGLTKLNFVSDKVKGAIQRGYKGARGTVLLSAVKLGDEATARALWAEIERVVPQKKVALSVRTALGDGAHWYFERKNRHCMLWQHGAWFFAVETKLASDDATVFQERQFSDQVLSQLRSGLAATKPSALGPSSSQSKIVEGVTR